MVGWCFQGSPLEQAWQNNPPVIASDGGYTEPALNRLDVELTV